MEGRPVPGAGVARSSAWFEARIDDFRRADVHAVLGSLADASRDVTGEQMAAWREEVELLQRALEGVPGHVFLEFDVPRLGSRIDAVVVSGAAVMAIEFKVGAQDHDAAARDQTWDYGLDLKNFHLASHDASVFPLLVATKATRRDGAWAKPHPDGVRPPRLCDSEGIGCAIREASVAASGPPLDATDWGRSPYHPTPTIVEAARALYARHSVEAIARHDAGAKNLGITAHSVERVIEEARRDRRKSIVFVTGVPGAGKTLVGLDVATRRRDETDETHAVYLSGNEPLVAVLREALVRDEYGRRANESPRPRKGAIRQKVKPFIQNVHHFRDDGVRDKVRPPHDHVVIFDEAQRAWNERKTSNFMRRKKKEPHFHQSEPDFLVGYLDRHTDWAVVVCLVGGGQEIHDGEAGISAWLDALEQHYRHWRVHVSPYLSDTEYAAVAAVASLSKVAEVRTNADLHLAVSMRSFRAERLSGFVKAALDGEVSAARDALEAISLRYPVVLTRNLDAARRWVRSHARGTERYGLLASSQAARLKPHAIDIRVEVKPIPWFLNDASDTRSSWYLEDAATEFQVQGLELDWTCVTWDADLRRGESAWKHFDFHGRKWRRIKGLDRRRYLVNAYRVLLTRARQGMAIFVPPGDALDPTRAPDFYDGTYAYLQSLGVPSIDEP